MKGLILDQKGQVRLKVLNRVLDKSLSVREASPILGLSERQVWRILAAYRKEGAAALVHGNRGRKPVGAISEGIKVRVRELAQGFYAGVNHCHLTSASGGWRSERVFASLVPQ